jgi:hypothetical protein
MADTDAQAIQAEMDRILGQLCGSLRMRPTQSVSELQQRYQQLAAMLPRTGAEAYVLEIVGRRLSSGRS